MKKIILFLAISFFASWVYGQGQMDAFKLSGTDLSGSARGIAMGGAFGALGGDITGVSQNPAGIGVYRSSEVVGSLGLASVNTETNTLGNKVNDSKFNFSLDNFAYIAYMPLTGSVKAFNLGFSYNRLKNFGRNYHSVGNGLTSSLTDYMADYTTLPKKGGYPYPDNLSSYDTNGNFDTWPYEPQQNLPWISVLGYNGGLINDNGERYISPLIGPQATREYGDLQNVDRIYSVSERGHIDSYDFTMGANISDILYLGLNFSVTDLRYSLRSRHTEEFERGENFDGGGGGGFDLDNSLETSGSGFQVTAGALFRPIDELRIGVAYHSPTWYNLTDSYFAQVNYEGWYMDDNGEWVWPNNGLTANTPGNASADYKLRTPDRWVMSMAGVLGTKVILSVDYEYSDYSRMNLGTQYGLFDFGYAQQNDFISQDFKGASTLKAGLEYKVTPQVALRAGYTWMQNPLEASFKSGGVEVLPNETVTAYTLDGDANYYSIGAGYRFTPNFYMDFAFSFKQQTNELYTYSPIWDDNGAPLVESVSAKLKNNTNRGILTLGYKF
ncbi:MAG: outer membrane protein transport protein [Candidatus Azobacteroides sp.]|nr:outer membrane protein transport protein [Candidatus Azobacteroides sp.]